MQSAKYYKFLGILLFTIFVISLLSFGAEMLVRFRQSQRMGGIYAVQDIYRTDTALNLRLPIAGKTTKTIHIDSRGFRNDELVMPKPKNLIRIAYIGASTTFCAEASSNEKTWPHLTTELLRHDFPSVQMDYINAGVPGYGVNTSQRHMRNLVLPLNPDVIVIYHATNDLSSEMREIAKKQGAYTLDRVEDDSWLAKHSVLWSLVEKNLRIIIAQNGAKDSQEKINLDTGNIGKDFERDLSSLIQEAKKIAPIVVVITFSIQTRPQQTLEQQLKSSASALYYMPFITPGQLIRAFDRYNEIIRQVAKAQGILLVEAADKIPGNGENFNDSVHFKDAGSEFMANLVAPVIAKSEEFRRLLDTKK